MRKFTFLEFFAGGGLARSGLGDGWKCLLANDLDAKKGAAYADNWGSKNLVVDDVKNLKAKDITERADLAWASFPCQDLSQAGAGAGLKGHRSGTFWPFWEIVKELKAVDRAPRMIVLENVQGAITSHDGKDFAAICRAMVKEGYRVGAVLVDAARFVPQSRTRLFVIAIDRSHLVADDFVTIAPSPEWHSKSLIEAVGNLSERVRKQWVWWKLTPPAPRTLAFSDVVDADDVATGWHTATETNRLISMMTDLHVGKLATAKASGKRVVGTIYKRRRVDETGGKHQRAEARFDDVAGCLRTPTGGSSRQTIIIVEGETVRTRLLQPSEAARLMGLDDKYRLPENYYDAYHLVGDGVAVPVVRFLAANILEPLLSQHRAIAVVKTSLPVARRPRRTMLKSLAA